MKSRAEQGLVCDAGRATLCACCCVAATRGIPGSRAARCRGH